MFPRNAPGLFSRALALCALVWLALPPAAGFGQGLGFGPDPLATSSKFEVTYSGFDQVSEVGSDYVYGEPLTQQVQTLGATWDLRMNGFLLRTAFEGTDSGKRLGTIEEQTQVSDQLLRLSLVRWEVFVPYIGTSRSFLATSYNDGSQTPALTVDTRDELVATFIGFTAFFPFADTFVPFLGYGRSSEKFAIYSEITGLPIPDEVYGFQAHFFEGGILLGREEGFHASWILRARQVDRVEGVTYALEGMTVESEEAKVGYGSPRKTGIELGYLVSRQSRDIEDYFSILRTEVTTTLEFKINEVWRLKLSQSDVSSEMDFLLTNPVTNSRNRYRKNSLTIVWKF